MDPIGRIDPSRPGAAPAGRVEPAQRVERRRSDDEDDPRERQRRKRRRPEPPPHEDSVHVDVRV